MELNSFWLHAQKDPEKLAIVEPDGTEHSAGAVLSGANQLVHALRALGFQPGDTLATVLPNCAKMLEIALACGQAGFYITPINHHLTLHEIGFILADSAAKLVITSAKHQHKVREAVQEYAPSVERYAIDFAEGYKPYHLLKAGHLESLPEKRIGGFAMTYTSGTTGRPRGVRRPFGEVPADHLAHSFTGFLQLFGIQPGGVHLCVAPLYHTAVINFSLYSLHFGHTVVLMDKWTAEGTLERIQKYGVTTTHMVPTQFSRMLALDPVQRARYDLSSMQHMVHGAAPCPIEVKHQMLEWFGPVVYEYYAASEGGGTIAPPQLWLAKPGTVGMPWPISRIEIRDDEGETLKPGDVGTVWIAMGQHKFSYHGDDDKTRDAWAGDFFTVGDAGYLDEEGALFLCDRKADMIISGGVNIYPAEIEGSLIMHRDVVDCAVFGVPDDDWGEQVKAVVELRDGAAENEEAIIGWCRERLAPYKCPRTVDFVDALPRDPNGKLYKRKLRDPYWEDRGGQI